KTFYRFLLEEKLITDQDFDMSGVRTPQDAHEKSTKWMLNNENMGKDNVLFAREGREEFARLLVKINGIDLVLQKEWADKLQVEKLSAALTGIISARVDLNVAMRGLDIRAPSLKDLWPDIDVILSAVNFLWYQQVDDYRRSLELRSKGWASNFHT